MRSTLAIHTARAKPRRRQLLRKARERLERVGGPAIVPVPFVLRRGLQTRKAANSGDLKVGSGEDPSPEDYNLESTLGCEVL
jgi:hypothetical protein